MAKREVRIEDEPVVVTKQTAAQRLSVSTTTIDRMLRSGQIMGVRVHRRTMIPAAAIDSYVEDHPAEVARLQASVTHNSETDVNLSRLEKLGKEAGATDANLKFTTKKGPRLRHLNLKKNEEDNRGYL